MANWLYYRTYCRAKVETVLDSLRDLWRGRYFGGRIESRYAHLGAHRTQSSFYYVLRAVFARHRIKPDDVLVDVGCGKGRVIDWWLSQGYTNRIVGIEIDEEIARCTAETFKPHPNVQIIAGSAVDHIPADGTLFYFCNSFDNTVLHPFKERLKQMFRGRAGMTLIYVNYEYLDVFRNDPDWRIERTPCLYPTDDHGLDVREIDLGILCAVAFLSLKEVAQVVAKAD